MPSGLVLIDFQRGFENPAWGPRNNPMAEANAARLLEMLRNNGGPSFHVTHWSNDPDSMLKCGNARADTAPDMALSEPQVIHDAAVSHLHGEFARAMTTSDILKEIP